jgi:regulator of replication initiation timing
MGGNTIDDIEAIRSTCNELAVENAELMLKVYELTKMLSAAGGAKRNDEYEKRIKGLEEQVDYLIRHRDRELTAAPMCRIDTEEMADIS